MHWPLLIYFYIKCEAVFFSDYKRIMVYRTFAWSIDTFEKINPAFKCVMPFLDLCKMVGSCCNAMLSLPCSCNQKASPSILVHPSLWNSKPLRWIQKLGGELALSQFLSRFSSLYLCPEQVKKNLYVRTSLTFSITSEEQT